MKKYTFAITPTLLLFPMLVQAQLIDGTITSDAGFGGFIAGFTELINDFLIPFMIALCVLAFIYGVYKFFILGSSDEDKRTEGRSLMLYALLGFVAIVALWGIVGFLVEAFGFDDDGSLTAPSGPGVGG